MWHCSMRLEMNFSAQRCTAKLEDHVVVLRADVDLAILALGSISLVCANLGRSGADFRLACSESNRDFYAIRLTGQPESKNAGKMFVKSVWIFRSIILAIVSRSSSPEVLPCGFSFPGSQSFSCGDC